MNYYGEKEFPDGENEFPDETDKNRFRGSLKLEGARYVDFSNSMRRLLGDTYEHKRGEEAYFIRDGLQTFLFDLTREDLWDHMRELEHILVLQYLNKINNGEQFEITRYDRNEPIALLLVQAHRYSMHAEKQYREMC
jgi:hypothetical protein